VHRNPTIYPGDVRFAFAVLGLAALLLVLFALTLTGAFLMKRPLLIGCAVAAFALSASACSTIGGSSNAELLATLKAIATDPSCGHVDRVNVTLGALPSGSVFLERNCPLTTGDPSAIPR
jgi:hypothetical protein